MRGIVQVRRSLSGSVTAGVFALLLLGGAGCGSQGNGGTGEGSSESSATSEPTNTKTVAIDPCRTLTPDDLAKLGIEGSGTPKRIAGAPMCDFKIASGGGVSVLAHNDKSLDEVNLKDGKVEDISVSGLKGKIIREGVGPGDCSVIFPSSASTAINITTTTPRQDTEAACQVVQEAAPLVLANLPKS